VWRWSLGSWGTLMGTVAALWAEHQIRNLRFLVIA
jgi:hypothetical protein